MESAAEKTDEDTVEEKRVKEMIKSFFALAGVHIAWNGKVNDAVAAVFGIMLTESAQCSKAMSWVPRPSGGPVNITYLARFFGLAAYRQLESRISVTCARRVVQVWRSDFEMAARGLAAAKVWQWA